MKKNSKRILVALLAAAMALSMTACSEEPTDGGSSNEPDSSVSEQVSEPESSDLEVEDGTSSDAESESESEAESSDPAANNTSSSAADTGSSTASQPAADQSSSQAQQPATSSQTDTSSQTQAQAPTTAQTSNTSSGKGSLANYTVSIQDSSTPAVSVSGKNINGKSGYYFYSANDDILGYIASSVVSQINRDYKMIQKTDEEHKAWYVEQFNVLRGLEGRSGSTGSGSSGSTGSSSSEIDIEELREEFIRLTNEERENPKLLNASRRIRIAKGSGTQVQDINKFMKSFELTQSMMKKMKNGSLDPRMKKMMKGLNLDKMSEEELQALEDKLK